MKTTQWFVECNPKDNESLVRLLAERCIDVESKFVGLRDAEGRQHDAWLVPSEFVTRLRSANRGSTGFKFRFFVRDTSRGIIRPADFLEQKKPTAKKRKAQEGLETILKRREKSKKSTTD